MGPNICTKGKASQATKVQNLKCLNFSNFYSPDRLQRLSFTYNIFRRSLERCVITKRITASSVIIYSLLNNPCLLSSLEHWTHLFPLKCMIVYILMKGGGHFNIVSFIQMNHVVYWRIWTLDILHLRCRQATQIKKEIIL